MKSRNTEEEGMGPLELGRKKYQEKDYKGAVEVFTNVGRDIHVSIC